MPCAILSSDFVLWDLLCVRLCHVVSLRLSPTVLLTGSVSLVNRNLRCLVMLYLSGLNYYGLLKPLFSPSQCDSTSLPVQRS